MAKLPAPVTIISLLYLTASSSFKLFIYFLAGYPERWENTRWFRRILTDALRPARRKGQDEKFQGSFIPGIF
jgi:hypothetical protein